MTTPDALEKADLLFGGLRYFTGEEIMRMDIDEVARRQMHDGINNALMEGNRSLNEIVPSELDPVRMMLPCTLCPPVRFVRDPHRHPKPQFSSGFFF